MELVLYSFTVLVFLVSTVFFAVFSMKNFRNGFSRAGKLAAFFCAVLVLLLIFLRSTSCFTYPVPVLSLVFFIACLVRFPRVNTGEMISDEKHDERDISFARYRLKSGSEEYASYYGKHPEKEDIDSRTRALPGLLSKGSKYFHRLNYAAADSNFVLLDHLRNSVDGTVSKVAADYNPEIVSGYLHSLAKHYGAACYGVTKTKESHYYSHVGRGSGDYGSPIAVEHSYAIVIGFEMKSRLTGTAPFSSEVVEVAKRYVDCAVSAIQTAEFIRKLGFSARAHIDGNYRTIVARVARDAGIGGYGWSNLLLTKKFGPRVRFSVVTTNMELSVTDTGQKTDFLSFCDICRKCAVNCPSRAISRERLEKVNGDRCFMYWNAAGTDCGRCIAVCPMGHPWGFLKSLALKSRVCAELLKRMDDLFYGIKPAVLPMPEWMNCENTKEEHKKTVFQEGAK